MLYSQKSSKGFTLLELLIVIAILAVLSAVTIVVLNPAELLRKARDSQRISDLSSVKTAIGYYLINAPSVDMDSRGTGCADEDAADTIYVDLDTAAAIDPPEGNQCLSTCSAALTSIPNKAKTDGNGWVPINFNILAGGSPLSSLPIDPNLSYNNTPPVPPNSNRYYSYFCHSANNSFEVMANMESQFYRNGGTGDVESKDGGDRAFLYEVGTDITLMPTSSTDNWYGGEPSF